MTMIKERRNRRKPTCDKERQYGCLSVERIDTENELFLIH